MHSNDCKIELTYHSQMSKFMRSGNYPWKSSRVVNDRNRIYLASSIIFLASSRDEGRPCNMILVPSTENCNKNIKRIIFTVEIFV